MPVQANVTNWNGLSLTGVYHRVERVFGGPKEGWTGLVQVYASSALANPTPPAVPTPLPFSFNLPFAYVAGHDPFADADAALAAYLTAQTPVYSDVAIVS